MEIFKNLIQGTEEWLFEKKGLISASKIAPLLTGKTLGAGAKTYAIELAAESFLTIIPETFVSYAMQQGIDTEPAVREKYATDRNVEVIEVGGIKSNNLWFSPDGLVGDDGIIEIKCPQHKQHFINLSSNTVDKQYQPQIQFGLMVSGRKWCDFISYNPYFIEKLQFKVIRVEIDWEMQTLISNRIKEFNTILQTLKNSI